MANYHESKHAYSCTLCIYLHVLIQRSVRSIIYGCIHVDVTSYHEDKHADCTYLSQGEKSMSCTLSCSNLPTLWKAGPPQRAAPLLWRVVRYEPWGDQRRYVSVQRCVCVCVCVHKGWATVHQSGVRTHTKEFPSLKWSVIIMFWYGNQNGKWPLHTYYHMNIEEVLGFSMLTKHIS